ncbi:MAG: hypothetical protein OXC11_06790 [Rhodospirillales bacterium]|nr:hypothetical protein [Rhodospirillales bacterium]
MHEGANEASRQNATLRDVKIRVEARLDLVLAQQSIPERDVRAIALALDAEFEAIRRDNSTSGEIAQIRQGLGGLHRALTERQDRQATDHELYMGEIASRLQDLESGDAGGEPTPEAPDENALEERLAKVSTIAFAISDALDGGRIVEARNLVDDLLPRPLAKEPLPDAD